MRYIGQKTKLLSNIESLLKEKKILSKDLVFCDAFSGTGTVSYYFQNKYKKIISNDNLYFSYIISKAKLNTKEENLFKNLEFDPFEYFNSIDTSNFTEGFIYKNYAPTVGKRQFFSDENAKLIDFIRITIQNWFIENKISEQEKDYLIACLIESISFVSNVAGVYGACLKIWDPRALKKMEFKKLDFSSNLTNLAEVYNEDIVSLIDKIDGDILYLDPPYTKNVYTTQYHLLETIAKYDFPQISGKGGLRNMSKYSTSFSKRNEAEIALEQIIKKAKFKYIILSYSSDGIICEDFIESLFKRYGKENSFELKIISYKRYKNSVAEENNNHKEYLFFIEKKEQSKFFYSSPLNYIGGKADLISWLKNYMPQNVNTFYDLFGGGLNVAINANAKKIVYNDINFKVKELLEFLIKSDTKKVLQEINKKIKKYGLEKGKKEPYLALRNDYNSKNEKDRNYLDLFLLIMFGFQQQIRFNSKYDYNNPVGQAGFNEKIKEKLISFVSCAKNKNLGLFSKDYSYFEDKIQQDDFVYLDPPYLITLGSYNDGKRGFNGWNENEEKRLLAFLDSLNKKNIKFMLSNVLEHKDKKNEILLNWIRENNFKIIENPNKTRGNRKEIIVVNYDISFSEKIGDLKYAS